MAQKKSKNLSFLGDKVAYIFLIPTLIIFTLFLFIPLIYAFYISFHDWRIVGTPEFIGLKNYLDLFKDPIFITTIINTLVFSLSVPFKVALALLFAVLLNQEIRGKGFYRAAFFFPTILSMVVVGIIWQWMFSANYGFINYFLSMIGLPTQSWLTSTSHSMLVVIFVSIWKGMGNNILLFLAGLQAIPSTTYEAASIDGANAIQKLLYITVPQLKSTTMFVFIITLIGSFKVFDLIYVLTGGGPGNSTKVMVQYIYEEAFQRFDMGYASAAAFIFFLILFILTLVQMKWFNGKEN